MVLWEAFLKTALYSSQNKTSVTDVFLVDAIMSTRLASNYSTYGTMYGLKKNRMDFARDPQISTRYAARYPQVIRSIPISHQLQLARQSQLHQCVPFVDVVTWICFVL